MSSAEMPRAAASVCGKQVGPSVDAGAVNHTSPGWPALFEADTNGADGEVENERLRPTRGHELPDDPCRPEDGVARERDLPHGREDAHRVATRPGTERRHKRRLRVVGLGGNQLHLALRQRLLTQDDGELVAGVALFGEDVDDYEPGGPWPKVRVPCV
jgi:hypothetical protein